MNVRVFAPAKINVTLKVGAVRADGYHPLQSAVMFADVGDWIEATPAADIALSVEGPFAKALEGDNLVLRAARVLHKHAGVAKGAALHLKKNLPVASGIGGGSSDAAATLKALNALWGLDLDVTKLAEIGREIGADVPVCLGAQAAWMTGIGERVAPLSAPRLPAVLVNPLQGLSTAAVFKAFDAMGLGAALVERAAPRWESSDEAWRDASTTGNDLMAPARALMPLIAEIEAVLIGDGRTRFANLSGSGATMFALVKTDNEARSLAGDIARDHPQWWSCATSLT